MRTINVYGLVLSFEVPDEKVVELSDVREQVEKVNDALYTQPNSPCIFEHSQFELNFDESPI